MGDRGERIIKGEGLISAGDLGITNQIETLIPFWVEWLMEKYGQRVPWYTGDTIVNTFENPGFGDTHRYQIMALCTVDTIVAEGMLASSVGNRPSRKDQLSRMKSDLMRGEYRSKLLDPIRFSADGRLMDGHHRLVAIKETGQTLPMLCIYGYDETDFVLMDQSTNRTSNDNLKIGNKKHTNYRAGAITSIYKYLVVSEYSSGWRTYKFGNQDAERIDKFFPDEMWDQNISFFNAHIGIAFKIPSAVIISLQMLYSLYDHELSQRFWNGTFRGIEDALVTKGDPRGALEARLRLENGKILRAMARRANVRWNKEQVICWIHYAWTRFISDRTCQQINFQSSMYDKVWRDLNSFTNEILSDKTKHDNEAIGRYNALTSYKRFIPSKIYKETR
jgi:hypothetical protein